MNEEEIECDDSFTMATMSNSSHESEFMNFNSSPLAEHEVCQSVLYQGTVEGFLHGRTK